MHRIATDTKAPETQTITALVDRLGDVIGTCNEITVDIGKALLVPVHEPAEPITTTASPEAVEGWLHWHLESAHSLRSRLQELLKRVG
jgi:hypothetical protein